MISRVLNLFSLKLTARPFFWGFCSCLIFFSSLSLSLMSDFFPLYFSFVLIFLMGVLFFLRATGLYLALAFLTPFFYSAFREKALWDLTVLYSLAIGYFTALLALEEDLALIASRESSSLPSFSPTDNTLPDNNLRFEQEKREFQQTIDQLKEEAQSRYLEMSALQQTLSSVERHHEQLEKDYKKELLEKELLLASIDDLKEKRLLESSALQEEIALTKAEYEKECAYVKQQHALLQTQVTQLQSQNQSQNETQSQICQQTESQISELKEFVRDIGEQKDALEQELLLLREKLEEEKMKCHALESEMMMHKEAVISQSIALEPACEKNKELADISGKYHQLREQFEEKSKVLSQTRKELFQAQTKLMVHERDKLLEQEDLKEEKMLITSLEEAYEDSTYLLEEIQHLEHLASTLLQSS